MGQESASQLGIQTSVWHSSGPSYQPVSEPAWRQLAPGQTANQLVTLLSNYSAQPTWGCVCLPVNKLDSQSIIQFVNLQAEQAAGQQPNRVLQSPSDLWGKFGQIS